MGAMGFCSGLSGRVAIAVLALTLTSCGGGGGGDGGGGGGGDGGGVARPGFTAPRTFPGEIYAPAANADTAAAWQTAEYSSCDAIGSSACSNALERINAAPAYASLVAQGREPGGAGVSIAIVDTGIDFMHSDLSLASGYDRNFDLITPTSDKAHGTAVASLAAGRRNGQGMHGVAFRANLISMGLAESELSTYFTAAAIAAAGGQSVQYGNYRFPAAASANIISLSLTDETGELPDSDSAIADAMRRAAAAGRIMVASLGNLPGQKGEPATHVMTPGIVGYALAVGALSQDKDEPSSGSHGCDGFAAYCLFAPGEGVVVAVAGTPGGLGTGRGTSFAAPLVAGAAAVLWAGFPNKDARAIVRRLLDTARDVPNQNMGKGILDLEAAVNPVGLVGFVSPSGQNMRVADSRIRVPSGYGRPADLAALGEAVVYDAHMFPFRIALAGLFEAGAAEKSAQPLADFLNASPSSPVARLELAGDRTVGFLLDKDAAARARRLSLLEDLGFWHGRPSDDLRGMRLHWQASGSLSVTLGHGIGRDGAALDFVAERAQRLAFTEVGGADSFAALAGESESLSLGWRAGRSTFFDVAIGAGQGVYGDSPARLAGVGLTQRLVGGDLTLGLRYGFLHESRARFGIRPTGAFGGLRGSDSHFVDMGLDYRLHPDVSLFGNFSLGEAGRAERTPQASLVTGWGRTQGRAWTLGAEFRALLAAADRLTVMASAPFRMTGAELRLRIPVREIADRQTHWETRRIRLSPSGRERRLQAGYETRLDAAGALTLGAAAWLRLQPGHDAAAPADLGMAARLRLRF